MLRVRSSFFFYYFGITIAFRLYFLFLILDDEHTFHSVSSDRPTGKSFSIIRYANFASQPFYVDVYTLYNINVNMKLLRAYAIIIIIRSMKWAKLKQCADCGWGQQQQQQQKMANTRQYTRIGKKNVYEGSYSCN